MSKVRIALAVELAGFGRSFREDFGDVHDPDRFVLPTDEAVEVHQARHIGRRQHLGSRTFVIGDSIEAHHA